MILSSLNVKLKPFKVNLCYTNFCIRFYFCTKTFVPKIYSFTKNKEKYIEFFAKKKTTNSLHEFRLKVTVTNKRSRGFRIKNNLKVPGGQIRHQRWFLFFITGVLIKREDV